MLSSECWRDLDVDWCGDGDVGNAVEDVGDLDGGAGGAHADEVAGSAGADEHVHADAVLAGLEAVELAHQDGGDGEDHDDLDGDGEDADERTERTMDEIADNQFVHARTSVWDRDARCYGEQRKSHVDSKFDW